MQAAGALPARYRRLQIGQQTGANGVWDYDFSVHNPTTFAGLENGIANCYTNPLWQVLNFIPELRCAAPKVYGHEAKLNRQSRPAVHSYLGSLCARSASSQSSPDTR